MKKFFLIPIMMFTLTVMPVAHAATVTEQELAQIKAQADELVKTLGDKDLSECAPILTAVYDARVLEFISFLEDNFSNKASNTSLTNVAIIRYTQFKKDIESDFAQLVVQGTDPESPNFTGIEFASYQKCSEITDLYLEMGKDAMMRHIKATAAAKRTTILLEKYQAINEKLNDLNFEISTMYSNFMTFKNKLPGFLSKCITN